MSTQSHLHSLTMLSTDLEGGPISASDNTKLQTTANETTTISSTYLSTSPVDTTTKNTFSTTSTTTTTCADLIQTSLKIDNNQPYHHQSFLISSSIPIEEVLAALQLTKMSTAGNSLSSSPVHQSNGGTNVCNEQSTSSSVPEVDAHHYGLSVGLSVHGKCDLL